MNGTQATGTNFSGGASCPDLTPAENSQRTAISFMHPNGVVNDLRLTRAEKREILASWASDIRTVPDAPALRRLDNGAVVRIGDVLRALNSLNEGETSRPISFDPFQSYKGMRIRLSRRLKSSLRRNWPDDDDPPPCPAMAAKPPRGPLSGEGMADLGLALVT